MDQRRSALFEPRNAIAVLAQNLLDIAEAVFDGR
jgi:hypothetical protein